MSFYGEHVLPRLINVLLGTKDTHDLRSRVASGLTGDVLEIGFGSGLNVPFYPAGLTRVYALDPAEVGRKLAARRVAASPVPVEYVGLDAVMEFAILGVSILLSGIYERVAFTEPPSPNR